MLGGLNISTTKGPCRAELASPTGRLISCLACAPEHVHIARNLASELAAGTPCASSEVAGGGWGQRPTLQLESCARLLSATSATATLNALLAASKEQACEDLKRYIVIAE